MIDDILKKLHELKKQDEESEKAARTYYPELGSDIGELIEKYGDKSARATALVTYQLEEVHAKMSQLFSILTVMPEGLAYPFWKLLKAKLNYHVDEITQITERTGEHITRSTTANKRNKKS